MIKIFKAADASCRAGSFPPEGSDIVINVKHICSVELRKLNAGTYVMISLLNKRVFFLDEVTSKDVYQLMVDSDAESKYIGIDILSDRTK